MSTTSYSTYGNLALNETRNAFKIVDCRASNVSAFDSNCGKYDWLRLDSAREEDFMAFKGYENEAERKALRVVIAACIGILFASLFLLA